MGNFAVTIIKHTACTALDQESRESFPALPFYTAIDSIDRCSVCVCVCVCEERGKEECMSNLIIFGNHVLSSHGQARE